MLDAYILTTRQLLQTPDAPDALYPDADLISFINEARKQTAGEGDCIRILGTIDTVVAQRNYDFADINTGASATNGVAGALRIEQILYAVGTGFQWVRSRPWPWFLSFKLSNPAPPSGPPQVWSQYGQGSTGSFYVDPLPDLPYTLTADCVCLPIDLATDADVEAIPPLWQTAVPFYAAYFALLAAQSAQRQGDADRMIARYTEYVDRARKFSTPAANRYFYPQREDLTQLNKLGISPKGAA